MLCRDITVSVVTFICLLSSPFVMGHRVYHYLIVPMTPFVLEVSRVLKPLVEGCRSQSLCTSRDLQATILSRNRHPVAATWSLSEPFGRKRARPGWTSTGSFKMPLPSLSLAAFFRHERTYSARPRRDSVEAPTHPPGGLTSSALSVRGNKRSDSAAEG